MIAVPYKGTQFRRRGIVSASFEATLCPVYRAYSYAVHRCIRRYSVAIPPSYRSFPLSPEAPLAPRSSTSVIVTEAHWTLSTMRGYRARVVDAPTRLSLRHNAAFANAMHAARRVTYLRARCVCFPHENAIDGRLFVDVSDAVHAVSNARFEFPYESNGSEWCSTIFVGVIDDRSGWVSCRR